MGKRASIKYRSLRSNLVHLPLSLFAQLAQNQTRPQGIIIHLSPVSSSSSRQAKEAYLGWTGLASASSLGISGIGAGKEALETVEIDPEVAMGLGMAEGTVVEISILHNPTKARSVSVSPLTPDDWEILEQHASFLEENLLSQLRAARKGQEIDVWVKGRTKIRIKVDDTDPVATSAVLINRDTEVYVAPRPRGQASTQKAEEPKVIEPAPTSSNGKQKAGKGGKEKSVKARLIPARVASAWGQLHGVEAQGRVLLASGDVQEKVKRRIGGSGDFVKVTLEQEESEPLPGPVVAETEEEDTSLSLEAGLIRWDELPEGSVVLVGSAEDEWEGWGTVKLSAVTTGNRKQKGKNAPVELPPPEPLIALAGIQKPLEAALAYLLRATISQSPRPLLLTGTKGSGKTSLAKLIGQILERNRDTLAEVIVEDVVRLDGEGRIGAVKENMDAWLENAGKKTPSLLVLDGLDTLLGPENELTPSSNVTALAHYFCTLFDGKNIPPGVLVIATATSAQGLHPLLNQKHVFGDSIRIPPANKETRREVLELLVEEETPSQFQADEANRLDYVTLASTTEGYTAADLRDLVGGALQQAVIRCAQSNEPTGLVMDDFTAAQAAFTPLSLRGVALQKSEVQWADIGGLHEPRRVLRETLEWPTKYAQIFANCPLRLRSGLLLYGYPGCGKTLLASAVAKECGLNFISVKGPEILNKYIGASEKSVRDLFERASAAKPCILFFDEFDSIAPKRGHDSTGVTDRVVNQLLTEMDGAQGLEGVYVLAATSRPDLIDSALLRPGRLDKSLLCDMPSKEDRLEIIKAVAAKLELDPSVDLEWIAEETEGLSGADLQAVVYNAHLEVVQESIAHVQAGEEAKSKGKGKGKAVEDKGKGKGKGKEGEKSEKAAQKSWKQVAPVGAQADVAGISARLDAILANNKSSTDRAEAVEAPKPVIGQSHLERSLANTRPSVSATDRARLHRIYSSFVAERDGTVVNGDDLGRGTGTRATLM